MSMTDNRCVNRVMTGVALGGTVGGAVGACYGTYEAFSYRVRPTNPTSVFEPRPAFPEPETFRKPPPRSIPVSPLTERRNRPVPKRRFPAC